MQKIVGVVAILVAVGAVGLAWHNRPLFSDRSVKMHGTTAEPRTLPANDYPHAAEERAEQAEPPVGTDATSAVRRTNLFQTSSREITPPRVSGHPIGNYDSTNNAAYDPTLKNVGFASPDDALQSQLWAISAGDVAVLSEHLALEAKGKKAAEKVFAELPAEFREKFGSIMGMIAFMQIADSPPVAAWSTTRRTSDNDEVIFTVRMNTTDGAVRNRVMRFVPTETGWSRIVTGNLILEWQKLLTEH